jgi:hypothetical protein
MKRWQRFAKEVLKDKAYLFVDGRRPNKIFECTTFNGAVKAVDILCKMKVRNWVLFSVQGFDRSVILMATAFLVQDVMDISKVEPAVYVEDKLAYITGRFPDTCGKPDKEQWKELILEVKKKK